MLPLPRVQLRQAKHSRPVAQPLSTGHSRALSGLVVAPRLHPLDIRKRWEELALQYVPIEIAASLPKQPIHGHSEAFLYMFNLHA